MVETVIEKEALNIAKKRAISAESVIGAWNKIIREDRTDNQLKVLGKPEEIEIRYRLETLREILSEKGWYLIYDPGFSLKEVSVILGSDPNDKPYHYKSNAWWFDKPWSDLRGGSGYYLVRVASLYRNLEWRKQESEIKKKGKEFRRASSRLVIVANISLFLLGKPCFEERISHWGPEKERSHDSRCACCFNKDTFTLFNKRGTCPSESIGVIIIRRPDF